MRSVVPRYRVAGRVRADSQDREVVAGADDGHRLLAVALGAADPVTDGEDLFAGWWRLIAGLGAVPSVGLGR